MSPSRTWLSNLVSTVTGRRREETTADSEEDEDMQEYLSLSKSSMSKDEESIDTSSVSSGQGAESPQLDPLVVDQGAAKGLDSSHMSLSNSSSLSSSGSPIVSCEITGEKETRSAAAEDVEQAGGTSATTKDSSSDSVASSTKESFDETDPASDPELLEGRDVSSGPMSTPTSSHSSTVGVKKYRKLVASKSIVRADANKRSLPASSTTNQGTLSRLGIEATTTKDSPARKLRKVATKVCSRPKKVPSTVLPEAVPSVHTAVTVTTNKPEAAHQQPQRAAPPSTLRVVDLACSSDSESDDDIEVVVVVPDTAGGVSNKADQEQQEEEGSKNNEAEAAASAAASAARQKQSAARVPRPPANFLKEHRPRVHRENPNASRREITQLLVSLWESKWDSDPTILTEYERGRKKKKATAKSKTKTTLPPEIYELTELVYVRWPENDQWYWGNVTKKNNSNDFDFLYSIKFKDGDKLDNVQPTDDNMCSVERYCFIWGKPIEELRKEFPELKSRRQRRGYKIVGSRCYARHENGTWGWGVIRHRVDECKEVFYCVFLDNGLKDYHVKSSDVYTEAEYYDVFGDPDTRQTLSLVELRARACGECTMCLKEDCRKCQSCVANQARERDEGKGVCLLKMCSHVSVEEKAQPLPELGAAYRFMSVDPDSLHHSFSEPLVPELACFCLVNRTFNKKIRGYEAYLKTILRSADESRVPKFYQKLLGIDVCSEVDHPLLGTRFLQKWFDAEGRTQEIEGMVFSCRRSWDADVGYKFTIKVDKDSCVEANRSYENLGIIVPEKLELDEAETWSGCALAQHEAGMPGRIPPPANMIIHGYAIPKLLCHTLEEVTGFPGKQLPRRRIKWDGFELTLTVKESGIPGGGAGVFLTCRPVSSHEGKSADFLELPRGTLIDLGPYAPLARGDLKSNHIALLKSFIHDGKPEMYSFSCSPDHHHHHDMVFDITDDYTGGLHESAQRHITPYVNETDGDVDATVQAINMPSGAVHYYLGYSRGCDQSMFRLAADGVTEVELKVDYGDSYEKNRIRNNYTRISDKNKLALFQEEILKDDEEFLEELDGYDAKEICEELKFLLDLWNNNATRSFCEKARFRILLLTLAVRYRISCLSKSLEEASVADIPSEEELTLSSQHAEESSKSLLESVLGHWKKDRLHSILSRHEDDEDDGELHGSDSELFRVVARKVLEIDRESELDQMKCEDLQFRLLNI